MRLPETVEKIARLVLLLGLRVKRWRPPTFQPMLMVRQFMHSKLSIEPPNPLTQTRPLRRNETGNVSVGYN